MSTNKKEKARSFLKYLPYFLKNRWWIIPWISVALFIIYCWMIPFSSSIDPSLPLIKPSAPDLRIVGPYSLIRLSYNSVALILIAICVFAITANPERWNSIPKRLSLIMAGVLLSMALTIGLFEGLSRIYLSYFAPPTIVVNIPSLKIRKNIAATQGYPVYRDIIQFESAPGWMWSPNISFKEAIQVQPGKFMPLEYNLDSFGLNNPDGLFTRTNGPEIVAIGDSFTFGVVPQQANWVTNLEKLLGEPIANLGMGGYGPRQELALFDDLANNWPVNLVIWQFFQNDLTDNILFDRWEVYYSDLPYRTYLNKLNKGNVWETFNAQTGIKQNIWLLNWGLALQKTWSLRSPNQTKQVEIFDGQYIFENLPPNTCSEYTKRKNRSAEVKLFPPDGYYREGPGIIVQSTINQALELIEEDLDKMQKFHLADDFTVLILYMPTRWDVYSYKIVEKLNEYYPAKCNGFSSNDLNSGFSAWLEKQASERDFLFLDPSDNLIEMSEEQKKILYYPFDMHTNSLGNLYLAEIIARFVTGFNIQ